MNDHDENPEWTKDDFAKAKPASKVHGKDAAAALVRPVGRPKLPRAERKQQVNMRFTPELLEGLRNTGPGWQTRVEEVLAHALMKGMLEANPERRASPKSLFEAMAEARRQSLAHEQAATVHSDKRSAIQSAKRSAKTGEFMTGSNDRGPAGSKPGKSKKA